MTSKRTVCLVAALLVVNTSGVFAQANKNGKKNTPAIAIPKAAAADYTALSHMKEVQGTLTAFDGNARTLSLKVDYSLPELNPNYKPPKVVVNKAAVGQIARDERKLQQLQSKMNHVQTQIMHAINANQANAKNIVQAEQHMMHQQQKVSQLMNEYQMLEMQMNQIMMLEANTPTAAVVPNTNPNNQMFRSITKSMEFELEISEKATYRKLYLGKEYDDQGKLKEAQKKASNGYPAKLEEITVGAQVLIALNPPKKSSSTAASKSTAPAPDETKNEGEEKEKKPIVEKETKKSTAANSEPMYAGRPTVRILTLTADPNAATIAGTSASAGKKN